MSLLKKTRNGSKFYVYAFCSKDKEILDYWRALECKSKKMVELIKKDMESEKEGMEKDDKIESEIDLLEKRVIGIA